jgi:acyl-CoA thioesterase-1
MRTNSVERRAYSAKQKIIIQLIGFLTVAAVFSGCTKSNITNLESQGKNIICFGDSITVGFGAQERQDYPQALAKMTNVPVINAGINGDTSSEAIKRINTDVLSKDPLLVIIEFGGNDFLNQTPMEETVKNIEEMIKIIQAKGAIVAIADISTFVVMGNYGKEFRRLSKKYSAILIPGILNDIITDPELKSDFVHPNSKGYQLIAHRVYRGIIPYLNQNSILRRLKKQ